MKKSIIALTLCLAVGTLFAHDHEKKSKKSSSCTKEQRAKCAKDGKSCCDKKAE